MYHAIVKYSSLSAPCIRKRVSWLLSSTYRQPISSIWKMRNSIEAAVFLGQISWQVIFGEHAEKWCNKTSLCQPSSLNLRSSISHTPSRFRVGTLSGVSTRFLSIRDKFIRSEKENDLLLHVARFTVRSVIDILFIVSPGIHLLASCHVLSFLI